MARTWAKGAVRPHSCTGQVCHRDSARKGGPPATRGTWTRRGWGTRSGGGTSKEGVKADGPVKMRSWRGVRARGSTRLKGLQRRRNPSMRPRGPSGTRGNRAGSSGEGTPFRGCDTVNGASETLAGDLEGTQSPRGTAHEVKDGGALGVMDGMRARAGTGATVPQAGVVAGPWAKVVVAWKGPGTPVCGSWLMASA